MVYLLLGQRPWWWLCLHSRLPVTNNLLSGHSLNSWNICTGYILCFYLCLGLRRRLPSGNSSRGTGGGGAVFMCLDTNAAPASSCQHSTFTSCPPILLGVINFDSFLVSIYSPNLTHVTLFEYFKPFHLFKSLQCCPAPSQPLYNHTLLCNLHIFHTIICVPIPPCTIYFTFVELHSMALNLFPLGRTVFLNILSSPVQPLQIA